MPSKYGFGNTRKKSPYKMGKAHYGQDQKNPIKLVGDQHKIDKNKDGKISKVDFDMMNSPAKMYGKKKSPMEAKTSMIDKIKSFGKAMKENIGKVHGHGGSDTLTHNTIRSYKKFKKQARDKAAKNKK